MKMKFELELTINNDTYRVPVSHDQDFQFAERGSENQDAPMTPISFARFVGDVTNERLVCESAKAMNGVSVDTGRQCGIVQKVVVIKITEERIKL